MRAGSFDLLLPVVDGEKDLFFTQVGIRRSNQYSDDYRNTVNLGAGYRRTFDEWLIGGNAFYDRDLTGKNARLGLGAEAWSDNLKLSANGYMRLTDWRKSADVTDYLERPANGWDVRAEAYLPMYPQLAGKLMYEQYYGDEVALFGTSNQLLAGLSLMAVTVWLKRAGRRHWYTLYPAVFVLSITVWSLVLQAQAGLRSTGNAIAFLNGLVAVALIGLACALLFFGGRVYRTAPAA